MTDPLLCPFCQTPLDPNPATLPWWWCGRCQRAVCPDDAEETTP